MPMNLGRGQNFAVWIGMMLLCALVPGEAASALQACTCEVCGAAVALGLALLKEANGVPK